MTNSKVTASILGWFLRGQLRRSNGDASSERNGCRVGNFLTSWGKFPNILRFFPPGWLPRTTLLLDSWSSGFSAVLAGWGRTRSTTGSCDFFFISFALLASAFSTQNLTRVKIWEILSPCPTCIIGNRADGERLGHPRRGELSWGSLAPVGGFSFSYVDFFSKFTFWLQLQVFGFLSKAGGFWISFSKLTFLELQFWFSTP